MRWLGEAFQIGSRRGCGLVQLNRSTFTYRLKPDPKEPALRARLKDLAATRVRYEDTRVMVLLRRECWLINRKRVYRLYKEEGLELRTKKKKKRPSHGRVPLGAASRVNEKWSMDFVTERLEDGRYFRILTVVDQYSRECLALCPAMGMTGEKVAAWLAGVAEEQGKPKSIMVDSGRMGRWSYQNSAVLDFIRPWRPVESKRLV